MRPTLSAAAVLAALSLAACGGDRSDAPPAGAMPAYARQITFGDSLSDVGSYAVGGIGQAGGGKFTINGAAAGKDPELTGKIWVEVLAGMLRVAAPCAAVTGLQGKADLGLAAPVQERAGCYNYAMGGARVTDPVGPGNAATGSPLGALTVPVAEQVDNHLGRNGGRFAAGDIVLVMAGGNDVLTLLAGIRAAAAAAGKEGGARAAEEAFAANAPAAIARMAAAGGELAAIVNDRIAGRGATRIVVNNLPDLGSTPGIRPLDEPVRQLVDRMVEAFNGALEARLAGNGSVLLVDIRALGRAHVQAPARFGLTVTSRPACGPNQLDGSSLACTANNVVTGEVGRFMFADDVHPTPFEHALIARHVAERMAQRGWLARDRLTGA